jgi:hypothetical protein
VPELGTLGFVPGVAIWRGGRSSMFREAAERASTAMDQTPVAMRPSRLLDGKTSGRRGTN